jgi:hypothetical protein
MPDRPAIGKQNLVPGGAALKAVRVRREQRQQAEIPKTGIQLALGWLWVVSVLAYGF